MTKHQHNCQKTSQIKDYMLKDYQDKKERLDSSLSQVINKSHVPQKHPFPCCFAPQRSFEKKS